LFLFLVATLIFVHQDAFHIARHLAAEFGTKLAVLLLQVFFILGVM
jgi:hypothetical protein